MPRDGLQQYAPPAGTQGIPNYTVESARYNTFVADISADQNLPRPIIAGGTGATNANDALLNLHGEAAGQIVTNYDAHVWMSGSFYSASTAVAAPGGLAHTFAGIAYVYDPVAVPPAAPVNQNVVLEARDTTVTPLGTGRVWIREKRAGVWGLWYQSMQAHVQQGAGPDPTLDGDGFSTTIANMFFGLYGQDTGPGSTPSPAFAVCSEASGKTGVGTPASCKLLEITKYGIHTIRAFNGNPAVYIDKNAAGEVSDLIGSKAGLKRWIMRLGDAAAETGANVGSDFGLTTCNDAGNPVATVVQISRANGGMNLSGAGGVAVTGGGGLAVTQSAIVGGNVSITGNCTANSGFVATIANNYGGYQHNRGGNSVAFSSGPGGQAIYNTTVSAQGHSFHLAGTEKVAILGDALYVRIASAAGYNIDSRGFGAVGSGAIIGFTNGAAVYGITAYWNAAAQWFSFYGSTGAFLASGTWATSDARLKSVDMSKGADTVSALAVVNAIAVRQFTAKDPSISGALHLREGETMYGWLAQEVEPILPVAVADVSVPPNDLTMRAVLLSRDLPKAGTAAAKAMGEEDVSVKAINDRHMLTTLWAAVQELTAQVNALKAAQV